MADLAEYKVVHAGGREATYQLSEEDAERLGGKKIGPMVGQDPEPVSRPLWADGADDESDEDEKAAKPPANKARTAKNK